MTWKETKSISHSQEKKRKRSHIWDLSSKDSQGTVQYMFKELKKFCLKN